MEREAKVIENSTLPVTYESLLTQLEALGGEKSPCLLVHSSLSALGWVVGGGQTVLQSLFSWAGEEKTLVMPSQTTQLTDPADWKDPPVPPAWVPEIRRSMPPFDLQLSPPYRMGTLVSQFWKSPGTLRSNHPHLSFLARGPRAAGLVSRQSLDFPLGRESPLMDLYEKGGGILLMGVGWESCTAFHLAESLQPGAEPLEIAYPRRRVGMETQWGTYLDFEFNAEVFPWIGRALEAHTSRVVKIFQLGKARCRWVSVKNAVDAAGYWLDNGDLERWNPVP